jgi:hypothetical protein
MSAGTSDNADVHNHGDLPLDWRESSTQCETALYQNTKKPTWAHLSTPFNIQAKMHSNQFQYSIIGKYEFRLISFAEPGTSSVDVALNIVPASIQTEQRPSYEAISYTWGDTQETIKITLNGMDSDIPHSLYSILVFLQRTLPAKSLLWADAICINQNDLEEKAIQIGLMGPIYELAELVRVFPSPDFATLDIDIDEITSFSRSTSIPLPAPQGSISDEPLLSHGFPDLSDPFWTKIRAFFLLPWFYRLWIIQEAVLARKLVIHCGDSMLEWKDLVVFVKKIKSWSLSSRISKPLVSKVCHGIRLAEGWIRVLTIDLMRSKYSKSIFAQLLMMRGALCQNPLDRVYGMLWLIEDSARDKIKPNYGKKVQEEFLEFNHLALSEYRDLASLPTACTVERLPQLPSWCSNLQSPLDYNLFSACSAGGELKSAIGPHLASSRDKRWILLQGYYVCSVANVLSAQFHECHALTSHRQCSISSLEWLSACFNFAKVNSLGLGELKRVLITDCLESGANAKATDQEIGSHFQDKIRYWDYCQKGAPGTSIPLDQESMKRAARMSREIPRANAGRKLFITESGRLGLTHHTVHSGDFICVFEGANAAFVLRPISDSLDRFEFISDAWVMGLMNGEALSMGLEERTFTIE